MNLLDELSIIQAASAVGITSDAKNWEACRALFDSEVDVGFTSLAGEAP